jgi:hypothetical protein
VRDTRRSPSARPRRGGGEHVARGYRPGAVELPRRRVSSDRRCDHRGVAAVSARAGRSRHLRHRPPATGRSKARARTAGSRSRATNRARVADTEPPGKKRLRAPSGAGARSGHGSHREGQGTGQEHTIGPPAPHDLGDIHHEPTRLHREPVVPRGMGNTRGCPPRPPGAGTRRTRQVAVPPRPGAWGIVWALAQGCP